MKTAVAALFIAMLISSNSWAADKDGAYVLKDVPAGTYKLVAWHEKLKDQEKTVVVPDGGEVAVDFALSRR